MKRGRSGADYLGQPFEKGNDAFHRLIAPAQHRPDDHHEHKQNPDQIPSVRSITLTSLRGVPKENDRPVVARKSREDPASMRNTGAPYRGRP
ncbi:MULTISPECIES: hypothetical protein [Mycolicibacterium]|uniref:hypothetical protein n=1 Tax=Mycolicibacterium TaxID=1866885 RepID=UPI00138AFC06|nr:MULTISPECIES: hypothetical protein [Mycolicibacterium]MCV7128763.1 hypothetical protein [Mycolicibacterium vanbaalenii PYR-1]QZY44369.1 hypothetical protein K5L12_19050 [Mycolicibacterium austroafricanum]